MGKIGAIKQRASRIVETISDRLLPPEFLAKRREIREWRPWIDSIKPHLLEDMSFASPEVKRRLFAENVKQVEIETHARCNRICWFCPNVLKDRRRDKTRASADMLEKLLTELAQIDFKGQLRVARYSEPMVDMDYLCAQLSLARRMLPAAQLSIVTNTDYLTRKSLGRLEEVGLDVLYMSLYLKNREPWSVKLAHDYSERIGKKIALPVSNRSQTPSSVRYDFKHPRMRIQSSCLDFGQQGSDRGATLAFYSSLTRHGPCREPFSSFVVDYTGAVVPCCNVRSDFAEHAPYVVGNLADKPESIFDIYAGQLAGWRKSMVGIGDKGAPCSTCRHREVSKAATVAVFGQLERKLNAVGMPELFAGRAAATE